MVVLPYSHRAVKTSAARVGGVQDVPACGLWRGLGFRLSHLAAARGPPCDCDVIAGVTTSITDIHPYITNRVTLRPGYSTTVTLLDRCRACYRPCVGKMEIQANVNNMTVVSDWNTVSVELNGCFSICVHL